MRKGSRRLAAAGGAGGALVVVWLVSSMFQGFGTGDGASVGVPTERPAATESETDEDDDTQPVSVEEGATTGAVHVVIERDGYSIATGEGDARTYRRASLEDVLNRARAAEPNERGNRVVISVRRGVAAGAHQDLVRELEEAGLEPDEIRGYAGADVAIEGER